MTIPDLHQLRQSLPTTSAATAAAEAAAAVQAATAAAAPIADIKAEAGHPGQDQADLECETYNARIHSLRLQLLDHMVGFLPKLREVMFSTLNFMMSPIC